MQYGYIVNPSATASTLLESATDLRVTRRIPSGVNTVASPVSFAVIAKVPPLAIRGVLYVPATTPAVIFVVPRKKLRDYPARPVPPALTVKRSLTLPVFLIEDVERDLLGSSAVRVVVKEGPATGSLIVTCGVVDTNALP